MPGAAGSEHSANLKYHAHTDRITTVYRYIHTDTLTADTNKTSSHKSFVSLALKFHSLKHQLLEPAVYIWISASIFNLFPTCQLVQGSFRR